MVIDRRYLIGLSSQKPITRSSINIITDQTPARSDASASEAPCSDNESPTVHTPGPAETISETD